MQYISRLIEQKLLEYLSFFSVVGITGPRQSGKSTLLQNVLNDYTYVTFDDLKSRTFFEEDPYHFMSIYSDKVIFDEAQKVPELFNHIKIAVDKDRNNAGKYILTGSSQFQMIKSITESLAGRIGLLSLLPFQYSEMPKTLTKESIYRGGYPELVMADYRLFEDWFSSYLDTYINKDVRQIANIGDLRDFQRLIQLLAANTAQCINFSRFATDIGVDVKTVKRWISVLEASYILFLVPPYYNNFGKRLIKSPKVYFYDTGLVSFFTGIDSQAAFEKGPLAGPIFENYIISEILKKESHLKTHAKLYYLRTNHGSEIDLIIDRKSHKEFIEIKSSHTAKPKMAQMIEAFMGENDVGYILYRGEDYPFTQNIKFVQYEKYLMDMPINAI